MGGMSLLKPAGMLVRVVFVVVLFFKCAFVLILG